jgi:hypothetical protein
MVGINNTRLSLIDWYFITIKKYILSGMNIEMIRYNKPFTLIILTLNYAKCNAVQTIFFHLKVGILTPVVHWST